MSRLPFWLQLFSQVEQVNIREKPAERLNATARPSGDTAGEKSDDFVGGEVRLRFHRSQSTTVPARQSPPTCCWGPGERGQKSGIWKRYVGYEALLATDGGHDDEGGTLFRHPEKADERPSGEKAGL